MERKSEPLQELYFRALAEIAEENGENYARSVAAETIAQLLSMVSLAAYRLPRYPLFLPPEEPSTNQPHES